MLAAFGKILPPQWRSIAFGLGTAAGSFGQFLFSPLAVLLMNAFGWQKALVSDAAVGGGGARCSAVAAAAACRGLCASLVLAADHRIFTCGFQIAFITVHLSSYLVDRGLSAEVCGWTIGVIGLFNIVGLLTSGWLGDRMPKRYLLSLIYFGRALAILVFILVPISPATCIAFGAFTDLLWLATVPPTNTLIVVMFGTRWLATLAGFAFFQSSGRRLHRRLARRRRVRPHRSYEPVWWLAILRAAAQAA